MIQINKDMPMPKACIECFAHSYTEDGERNYCNLNAFSNVLSIKDEFTDYRTKRHDNCPLKEV